MKQNTLMVEITVPQIMLDELAKLAADCNAMAAAPETTDEQIAYCMEMMPVAIDQIIQKHYPSWKVSTGIM